MKESVNNQVLFDKVMITRSDFQHCRLDLRSRGSCIDMQMDVQATYDKLQSEVPKYKMITTSILSDRLRVRIKSFSLHYILTSPTSDSCEL